MPPIFVRYDYWMPFGVTMRLRSAMVSRAV
jgi:hypothetical protein